MYTVHTDFSKTFDYIYLLQKWAAMRCSAEVPQGSIMGRCFSLFLSMTCSQFCLFAYELTVFKNSFKSILSTPTHDVSTISFWIGENFRLFVLVSSSPVYYVGGTVVIPIKTVWTYHWITTLASHHIIRKANGTLGCLMRYGIDFRSVYSPKTALIWLRSI